LQGICFRSPFCCSFSKTNQKYGKQINFVQLETDAEKQIGFGTTDVGNRLKRVLVQSTRQTEVFLGEVNITLKLGERNELYLL
jgi:hypothetical protein